MASEKEAEESSQHQDSLSIRTPSCSNLDGDISLFLNVSLKQICASDSQLTLGFHREIFVKDVFVQEKRHQNVRLVLQHRLERSCYTGHNITQLYKAPSSLQFIQPCNLCIHGLKETGTTCGDNSRHIYARS